MSEPGAQGLRRGFLYRVHEAAGARYTSVAGGELVADYGGVGEEARGAVIGLCDLSPLPRTGFKGREALDWLRGQGLEIGTEDNLAYAQEDGSLAARLAPTEAVVLSDTSGASDVCRRLDGAASLESGARAYPVPRQGANFWFALTGAKAPEVMVKLCAIDLRPDKFAALRIAQTSVARLNVIVIRWPSPSVPVYHLLADSASAEYMWRCLRDAMDEFEGRPIGYPAYRALAGG